VVPFAGEQRMGPSVAIEEYETDLGPADYVLADQADLLAVVEAKKLTVGPRRSPLRPSATPEHSVR